MGIGLSETHFWARAKAFRFPLLVGLRLAPGGKSRIVNLKPYKLKLFTKMAEGV
jgi:hypothetical protein